MTRPSEVRNREECQHINDIFEAVDMLTPPDEYQRITVQVSKRSPKAATLIKARRSDR
jgi:hypothetical protein